MAFIGNNVQTQGFTPAIDYFSGNGVTVTFTLSRPVASVAQVIIAIDNVVQNSSTAYSVSGNSITFTSAPLSGTNNIWVQYTSPITTYAAISQDPSVIGDITATGGFLSTGDFGNTYTDGTIVDYVTGNARITTGPTDGITLYNGGTTARNALMTIDASGNVGIGTSSPGDVKLNVNGNIAYGTGGTFGAGQLYSDANWGVILRAKQASPAVAEYAFQNAGGTERMRIDSSGNVGIGTTDPQLRLQVSQNTSSPTSSLRTTPQIYTKGFAGAGTYYGGISFAMYEHTNGYWGSGILAVDDTGSYGSSLAFYTSTGSATPSPTERMRIDSSGRVKTPYQTSFSAYIPSGLPDISTANTLINRYSAATYNVGNNYDTSLSRFTCPVAGTYFFAARAWVPPSGLFGGIVIKVNGSQISEARASKPSTSSNYTTVYPWVVWSCAAGDYVELYTSSDTGGELHTSQTVAYSNFSGYLLG